MSKTPARPISELAKQIAQLADLLDAGGMSLAIRDIVRSVYKDLAEPMYYDAAVDSCHQLSGEVIYRFKGTKQPIPELNAEHYLGEALSLISELASVKEPPPGEEFGANVVRTDATALLRRIANGLKPSAKSVDEKTDSPTQEWIPLNAARLAAACHVQTIKRAAKTGKLKARESGGVFEISQESLITWLSTRPVRAPKSTHPSVPKNTPKAPVAGWRCRKCQRPINEANADKCHHCGGEVEPIISSRRKR